MILLNSGTLVYVEVFASPSSSSLSSVRLLCSIRLYVSIFIVHGRSRTYLILSRTQEYSISDHLAPQHTRSHRGGTSQWEWSEALKTAVCCCCRLVRLLPSKYRVPLYCNSKTQIMPKFAEINQFTIERTRHFSSGPPQSVS